MALGLPVRPWGSGGHMGSRPGGCGRSRGASQGQVLCPPAGRGEHTPRAGVPEGGCRVPFPLHHHGECSARGPHSALSPGSRVCGPFLWGSGGVSGVAHTAPRRARRRSRQARACPRPFPLPPGRLGFRFRASGMGPACGPGLGTTAQAPPLPWAGVTWGNHTWGKGPCPHTWLGSGCRWVAGSPRHAGWEHACPVAQSAHTCGRGGHVWAGRTHRGRGGAGVWTPQTPSHIHCALCSPTNSDDPD